MINILEICSRIIQSNSSIPPKNILGIVLYRIFVGLLEKRTEYKETINKIFNEINVPLPSQFLDPINESPLIVTYKDGFHGLGSKITGLFIISTDAKIVDLNVAYTPAFIDMLDIIHFGICTKTPVILEGNACQGKQKAIEYVAKHLGYEVINIVISKSTKVDDLFGKVSFEHDEKNNIHIKNNFTKLTKAIKSNSTHKNTIFVLHNLNNASPAVLEKLASLFDRSQSEFSLLDGTTLPKGDINVICLFNAQDDISNREKLPASLINSSIYHITEKPNENDVFHIIETLFQPNFKDEVTYFYDKYKIIKKFASQNDPSSAVTLYDISKYTILRTVTNGFLDKDLIVNLLFGFRSSQHKTNNQVLLLLDFLKVIQPTFNLFECDHNVLEDFRTLTSEQHNCLLFLVCAVLTKRPCIVQGPTASGKSHIIHLFAKMLGRKLNVYQMDSDSNMSIFTGQSILKNEITEKDKNEFQISFSYLQTFVELNAFIQENFSIPYENWKPKQFFELLEKINNYEKNNTISDEQKELLRRAETKIKQTMSPDKRFHHVESALIKAMENGEWVVFDDLASAPPEIEEKLSSLCGDDQEIDLFEWGENFFSRNKQNSRKIHDNFQIFITYNPSSKTNFRALDPNFLNKCFLFTLPPLDSTNKSSEELLSGTLMKFHYNSNLANDLGKVMSIVHHYIKKDCLNNKNYYFTDSQFTARTLTFILKEFHRHFQKHENNMESIYKVLCRCIHLYYLSSYINTNKDIKKQLIKEISKEIDKAGVGATTEKSFDNYPEVAFITLPSVEIKRCNEEEEIECIQYDDDEELQDTCNAKMASENVENAQAATISQREFNSIIRNFDEREVIEMTVARMKEIDREKPLEIQPYTSLSLTNNYLIPDSDFDYPIMPLIRPSFNMSKEFLKVASDLNLPYSTMCVNLLIDCSVFISEENKTFNLFIICALTDVLTTLGIPYSAAVIGDQNFKAIIKPFEETHSNKVLQRICDCIHIKRYKAKLPGCIEYAINSMAFPNNARENRAIFIFTNGLDENLVKKKGWSELFKNSKLSFGFVFIKSSELDGRNLTFLENVWDTFEKNTDGKNSVVKVAKICANVDEYTIKLLVKLFVDVMNRTYYIDEKHKIIDRNYNTALFEIPEDILESPSLNISEYEWIGYNNYKSIYVQRSNILENVKTVIDQIDLTQFDNKLNRIATCNISNSLMKEYQYFIEYIFQSRKNIIDTKSLETIFKTNNLHSKEDNKIDFITLIINLLSDIPDPIIFEEENRSLNRNYGVSVVIDTSYSCFHCLSTHHSFQTILSLLLSLSSIDIPFFDLIIATKTNPIVLCSQINTLQALNVKSPLWNSLFVTLPNISPSMTHSDLASAIHAAFDLSRLRALNCTNLMFVLTDGLYQETERSRIIECVNNCVQSGMITFGIGMGIYPKGIEKLFPQYVFSGNPLNVMKGVSKLFTDSKLDCSDKMLCLNSSFEYKYLIAAMKKVSESSERPIFRSLCDNLSSISILMEVFNFENDEQASGMINPVAKDTEMYPENFLKTQKILIVQLCDDSICGDPQINSKYIFENYEKGRTKCINKAVKFFGISLQVVQNYEDAIHEITKSNNNLCEYYAVWIICGGHPEQLPTRQRNSNKYIVEQFIDVLIKFWKNGGSLVFLADNDPYTFHVNLFLNKVRFENEEKCPSGKVNFQIHGNHKGGKILSGDVSGKLNKEQTFNLKSRLIENRAQISHNLRKLNEGKTISFVENINVKTDRNFQEKILPFLPFAVDSEGGITILFYPANEKTGTGDIVIDCGFSKLFSEFNLKGTFRYIQNVAAWTCRVEPHLMNGINPCEWRPKAVCHTITNITSPNYCSFVNDLIAKTSNISTPSVL